MDTRIVSAPLAASAYVKGRTRTALIHAVEIRNDSPVRVLCGKVKVEHILDDESLYDTQPVTCPHCKSKM